MAADPTGETAATRSRRRPTEVHALLVRAAGQVFAAKGFGGATTAEIAAAAGVSESTLFRHFASKSDLFTVAAVEPFTQFMDEFAELWERRRAEGAAPGTLMRGFITELYDRLDQRRDVVLALLSTNPDGPEETAAAHAALAAMFARLDVIGHDWETARGNRVPGLELRERILIGAVTATVLFDDWFLRRPEGDTYSRESVIDALIDFARYGAERPAPPEDQPT